MPRHWMPGPISTAAVLIVAALIGLTPTTAFAQMDEARAWLERCNEGRLRVGGEVREQYCEVRNFELVDERELRIDGAPLGDIDAVGRARM